MNTNKSYAEAVQNCSRERTGAGNGEGQSIGGGGGGVTTTSWKEEPPSLKIKIGARVEEFSLSNIMEKIKRMDLWNSVGNCIF